MTETFWFNTLCTGVDTLLKGTESISLSDSLQGKEVVALYFSAHWCPPCRSFTP
jgi:nucleoredoxin